MRFSTYQKKAHSTAIYPKIIVIRKDGTRKDISWVYPLIGWVGEMGEVCNKLKKVIRDSNFHITPEMKDAIEDELGDSDWYKAEFYNELELDDHRIKTKNLRKLKSRKKRKVIKGKGDKR